MATAKKTPTTNVTSTGKADPKKPGNVIVVDNATGTKLSRPANNITGAGVPTKMPDEFFDGNQGNKVQQIATQLPDYEKYLRQFATEDYQQAKDRLDQDYNRFLTLNTENKAIFAKNMAEKQTLGVQTRRKNYEGAVRRASVGYIRRGLASTPGSSGIVQNEMKTNRGNYNEDVALFNRGIELDKEQQALSDKRQEEDRKLSYDRSRTDIETGQRRATVTDLTNLNNAL